LLIITRKHVLQKRYRTLHSFVNFPTIRKVLCPLLLRVLERTFSLHVSGYRATTLPDNYRTVMLSFFQKRKRIHDFSNKMFDFFPLFPSLPPLNSTSREELNSTAFQHTKSDSENNIDELPLRKLSVSESLLKNRGDFRKIIRLGFPTFVTSWIFDGCSPIQAYFYDFRDRGELMTIYNN